MLLTHYPQKAGSCSKQWWLASTGLAESQARLDQHRSGQSGDENIGSVLELPVGLTTGQEMSVKYVRLCDLTHT